MSEVRVDGREAVVRDIAAGVPQRAPAGTLLEVPLADCIDAGETRTVEPQFDLELDEDVDERVGTSSTAESPGSPLPSPSWPGSVAAAGNAVLQSPSGARWP